MPLKPARRAAAVRGRSAVSVGRAASARSVVTGRGGDMGRGGPARSVLPGPGQPAPWAPRPLPLRDHRTSPRAAPASEARREAFELAAGSCTAAGQDTPNPSGRLQVLTQAGGCWESLQVCLQTTLQSFLTCCDYWEC
ncbi:unnamed protein product [Eretmochelys imbricata]